MLHADVIIRSPDFREALRAASRVAVLKHHVPSRKFHIMESNVAAYLCDLPEVRQFVFNIIRCHGGIDYENGEWRGTLTKQREHIDAA